MLSHCNALIKTSSKVEDNLICVKLFCSVMLYVEMSMKVQFSKTELVTAKQWHFYKATIFYRQVLFRVNLVPSKKTDQQVLL